MTGPRRTTGDRNLGVDLIHVTQWCDQRAVTTGAPDRDTRSRTAYQLRNWLTGRKIEVYEAVDIITGLAACSEVSAEPDLAAIRLPTWDGYEVIRRLKDDPRTLSIPVIFLAACGPTAREGQGNRHGGGRLHLEAVRPGRAARPGRLGACGPRRTSTSSSSGPTSTA